MLLHKNKVIPTKILTETFNQKIFVFYSLKTETAK